MHTQRLKVKSVLKIIQKNIWVRIWNLAEKNVNYKKMIFREAAKMYPNIIMVYVFR